MCNRWKVILLIFLCAPTPTLSCSPKAAGDVAKKTIMMTLKEAAKEGLKKSPKYGVQGLVAGSVGTGVGIGISEAATSVKDTPSNAQPPTTIMIHAGLPPESPPTGQTVAGLDSWVLGVLGALGTAVMAGLSYVSYKCCGCKVGRINHSVKYDQNCCTVQLEDVAEGASARRSTEPRLPRQGESARRSTEPRLPRQGESARRSTEPRLPRPAASPLTKQKKKEVLFLKGLKE